MAEQPQSLLFLQPLIPKPITVSREPDLLSNSAIIVRLTSVLFVAILSLYANHEASKGGGIDIIIQNTAKNTPAGRRFSLFYLSNDKASRLALQASDYIQHLLYSTDHHHKKQISRVTVRLVSKNLTEITEVTSSGSNNRQFLIQISLKIMNRSDHMSELIKILQRSMARVWIYDNGPKHVIDGIVELLASSPSRLGGDGKTDLIGGGDCWMDEDPRQVARLLEECERQREGFIKRLNQEMRDGWSDRTVDNALGIPGRNLCGPVNQ